MRPAEVPTFPAQTHLDREPPRSPVIPQLGRLHGCWARCFQCQRLWEAHGLNVFEFIVRRATCYTTPKIAGLDSNGILRNCQSGTPGWDRTTDHLLIRRALLPLSYRGENS